MRLDSAELNPRLPQSFLLRKAFAHQVSCVALDVEAHLGFHLSFKLAPLDDPLQPRTESSHKIHICSEVVRRMLAINEAMRFHFSVSECSRRRPFAVRL